MDDSEEIVENGNALKMIMDIAGTMQLKLFGILFLVFMFVSSEIFVLGILERVPNAVDFKTPTTYGVMLQAAAMVMIGVVVDLLIRQKII